MLLYTTGQWAATIRGAKKKSPFYKVTEMEQEDFLDFKSFSTQLINMSKTVENETVNFLKIRKYTVFKNDPVIYISYSMDEEVFKMNLLKHGRKSKEIAAAKRDPAKAYNGVLKIMDLKRDDLLELCTKKLIPPAYHDFFKKTSKFKSDPVRH